MQMDVFIFTEIFNVSYILNSLCIKDRFRIPLDCEHLKLKHRIILEIVMSTNEYTMYCCES